MAESLTAEENTSKPQKRRPSKRKAIYNNHAKPKQFWCDGIPFTAYQLGDGEIAFSLSQMIPGLERIQAVLPNKTKIDVYPLQTVKEIWACLESRGRLPGRESLLKSLLSGKPITQRAGEFPKPPEPEDLETEEQLDQIREWGLPVTIELGGNQLLILTCNQQFYVCEDAGLQLIGIFPSWLKEVRASQASKRSRKLKQLGFSGEAHTITYLELGKTFQVQTLVWSDWLAIWEYLAQKGNTRCVWILKELAARSLRERVEPLLPEYALKVRHAT